MFASAEIDPAISGKQIVVADQVNGTALPAGIGPLRVVALDEKRHARWIRQVEVVRVEGGK